MYTAYAVGTPVILAALEGFDGTREGVTEQLFQVSTDTVIRPISFDENGDPAEKFESVFQGKGGAWTFVEQVASAQ